jgi:lysophospholipase L1-like esterase
VLREVVLPLRPDLVVLGFGGNNAFRLATMSDAERLESYDLRKLVLRSRLLHILAAWMADRPGRPFNPRDRDEINALPLDQLRRVAAPDELVAALRTMVAEIRAAGAQPVFMIFPRASSVSQLHRTEDNASGVRFVPLPAPEAPIDDRDMGMLEASCLDVRRARESIATIRAKGEEWQVVYPDDPMVRAQIKNGADHFVRGEFKQAWHTFNRALGLQRSSPLATYDRGVIAVLMGDTANGLRDLKLADELACNVFLHYNVLVWELAIELGVPVVDLTLWFQSHDGELLFIDPAHPNIEGQAIIAEALWPALTKLADQRTTPSPAAGEGREGG